MGPTHATPSVALHRSPGWLGIIAGMLAGLVIGASLTLGGLFASGRIDLGAAPIAAPAAGPLAAAQLYATHVQREHRVEVADAVTPATVSGASAPVSATERYIAQFAREHRADLTTGGETTWQHVQREYGLGTEATVVSPAREHFIREHRTDATAVP